MGSASKPIDTAYITNIVPPPGGSTPTLQEVCDTGNNTTTGLNVDGDYGSTNGDITTTNGDITTTNGKVLAPQINQTQATDTLHIVGKVGVGVNPADPITEDLEVDGNIQIDTSGLGRLVFYDKNAGHEHGEYDADDDGVLDAGEASAVRSDDCGDW